MTTQTLPEAKRAWLISQMIDELNELLWNHYKVHLLRPGRKGPGLPINTLRPEIG